MTDCVVIVVVLEAASALDSSFLRAGRHLMGVHVSKVFLFHAPLAEESVAFGCLVGGQHAFVALLSVSVARS